MPINYSSLYSFENVNPIIKKKRLKEFDEEKPISPKPYWGDPTRPDPSVTGTPPMSTLGKTARDVLTGRGGTPPINGGNGGILPTEGNGNYLGIPQKNLAVAFGLSALSHAVNPSGPGKELMHTTGAMLSENARIGERARELMRLENRDIEQRRQEIADQELTYQRGLEKEQRERGYKLEDTEDTREYERGKTTDERRYNAPLRNAQIASYLRGPKPSEFDKFEINRKGKINPRTNQPFTYEENLVDYKSLGRENKIDEETTSEDAAAELQSFGINYDKDSKSIDFPQEMEGKIKTTLKKRGISYYPAKSTDGMKKYYLGKTNPGQVSQPSGTTFNLEDYLPNGTTKSW